MITAEDYIDERVDSLQDGEEVSIPQLMREYALLVAKEALKNASYNAKTVTESFPSEGSGSGHVNTFHSTVVDKQSILNESNIPKP